MKGDYELLSGHQGIRRIMEYLKKKERKFNSGTGRRKDAVP